MVFRHSQTSSVQKDDRIVRRLLCLDAAGDTMKLTVFSQDEISVFDLLDGSFTRTETSIPDRNAGAGDETASRSRSGKGSFGKIRTVPLYVQVIDAYSFFLVYDTGNIHPSAVTFIKQIGIDHVPYRTPRGIHPGTEPGQFL